MSSITASSFASRCVARVYAAASIHLPMSESQYITGVAGLVPIEVTSWAIGSGSAGARTSRAAKMPAFSYCWYKNGIVALRTAVWRGAQNASSNATEVNGTARVAVIAIPLSFQCTCGEAGDDAALQHQEQQQDRHHEHGRERHY